ncbi:MAG: hypothetical protein CVV06_16625 [Gammaproteobacteria bacterium HGW-Gammaproteobacteria-10]|nr:MAG: hypothetical protein CVV06_16625 [Gammaproteobacteria bacterium HGW-Gammaproteobacteria-10]
MINLGILNISGFEIATKASLPQGGGCSVGAIPKIVPLLTLGEGKSGALGNKNGIEASLAKIAKQ